MAELKELLERINEKIPRKKEDAIARILEIYDLQQLDVMFPARYYQLTETGKAEVEQNEYVLYLHRHRLMTVWEMNSLLSKTNTDPKRYRDIIWGELQRQSIEHMQKGDFGLYRNDKLAMHDILVEEKKYREALLLLCEVISYDLSGLSNGELSLRSYEDLVVRQVRFNSKMASLIFNPSSGEVTLPPGIIRYYESLFKSLEMTADEFIRTSYQLFNRIQIHERVFTAEECANIALSEIGLEERKLKNSYQIAQQRIKGVTVKYYASIMKEPSPPKV